jgi:hypothetical protein
VRQRELKNLQNQLEREAARDPLPPFSVLKAT